MIDTKRCMAKRDGSSLWSGDRCQEPATHDSVMGRRCPRHAEELREALRNPNTLGNILTRKENGCSEEEIARLVVELSS